MRARITNTTRIDMKTRRGERNKHGFRRRSSIVFAFRIVYVSHRCPLFFCDGFGLLDGNFTIEEESEGWFGSNF